mmetsp:Transcript_45576/g.83476  ORF Transcript_45576/g.83476 Transcript_45576/m.83476 type:complete len:100 (+) Transcript_45576:379-678(+)
MGSEFRTFCTAGSLQIGGRRTLGTSNHLASQLADLQTCYQKVVEQHRRPDVGWECHISCNSDFLQTDDPHILGSSSRLALPPVGQTRDHQLRPGRLPAG